MGGFQQMLMPLSLIGLVSGVLAYFIRKAVPDAYMDEIFHIPQARHYCDFNWTVWDPMITTLPGLYLSSMALLFPMASILNLDLLDVCTISNLRAVNQFFTVGNFVLLYILTSSLQNKGRQSVKLLNALVLTLFPVSYFFTFLYYTDQGSIFFTLLMYLLCLKERHFIAACCGAIAILFRQTNVVWVIFCIALVKIDILEKHVLKLNKGVKIRLNDMRDYDVFKLIVKTLVTQPLSSVALIFHLICRLFVYLLLVAAFVLFVHVNQGVAVGDRTHHNVSKNFPQVLYFLLVSAAFSFVHLVWPRQMFAFVVALVKNPLKTFLFVACAYFMIKNYTYEHIYLLSDNRHYTFYVWSKLFKRHEMARYVMIPAYLYSLYQFYGLTVHKGFLWRVWFAVCTITILFPLPLLEFRYFIMPFYIMRLNSKLLSFKCLLLELLFYIAVNAITVHLFLHKPFIWPNEPEHLQRFMW